MPFSSQAREASAAARRRQQAEHDQLAGPRITALRAQGKGWRETARALDAEGIPTPRGSRRWHPEQVKRIADRQAGGPDWQPLNQPRSGPLQAIPGWLWAWFRRGR